MSLPSNQLTQAAMFFNRICGFAAETGILLGFWLTGQSGPTSCLAEALQDSDGADYTSIAAARWIEQSLRGVICAGSQTVGIIVVDIGSTSNGQSRLIAEAKPWRS